MSSTQQHRVFVTGASGFVGSEIVAQLLQCGHEVVAMARRPDELPQHERLTAVRGDLLQNGGWKESLTGCTAVIHLVGIIRENRKAGVTFGRVHFEATSLLLRAAREASVGRFIHMSALGTRPEAVSLYHRTKLAAEDEVRASKLQWTIFRPSVIYGPRGEFTRMVLTWARSKLGFMPYFGGGAFGTRCANVQPVCVQDVARACTEALTLPGTISKCYDIAGPQLLPWPEFYRALTRAYGISSGRPLAVPAWLADLLATVLPASLLPFTRDQIIMSLEEHAGDPGALVADFGWRPRGLDEASAAGTPAPARQQHTALR